jgi:hypothetical protein
MALLTFKRVVRYSSVCIAHNQRVEILKIISLYIQPCKQKSHVYLTRYKCCISIWLAIRVTLNIAAHNLSGLRPNKQFIQ